MPVARLVARHPPHRTVLALLTHTVPRDPGELFGCFYPVLHPKRWPSTPRNRLGIPQYPHTPILVRAAISGLYYSSLSLRPAAWLALLSELTGLSSSQRGLLLPGFRRFGHPHRRRISLQCQLGNLH